MDLLLPVVPNRGPSWKGDDGDRKIKSRTNQTRDAEVMSSTHGSVKGCNPTSDNL